MYTVSLNSSRFRHLVITFACLPLLALLLSRVLNSSVLTQTHESNPQVIQPTPADNELLLCLNLPQMTNNRQVATGELPFDTTDLCAGMCRIPDSDLCTDVTVSPKSIVPYAPVRRWDKTFMDSYPNKLPLGIDSHPPILSVAHQ